MIDITQDLVREFLDYDPTTGVMTWRNRNLKWFTSEGSWKKWNTRYAGKVAGNLDSKGYPKFNIFRRTYRAHRIIWLWMTGYLPEHDIDHENHVRTDNRWENLKCVTHLENQRNMKLRHDNVTGSTGIHVCSKTAKWISRIKVDGKQKHLGLFERKEDAIAARKSAELEFGFHKNHGA